VDGPLNEKIDVWSLGNNMYSLLTGLTPFYDTSNDTVRERERHAVCDCLAVLFTTLYLWYP
jgi:serine/threonine protein kinase